MIKMLNLYRCSSEEPRISEKDVNYFVTDYFDGIKVEDLNSKEVTLAECMGIKRGVPGKVGISHQRYCLFTENGEEDIFHASSEFPVFALIQVFINPDIYQAKFFDDKEVISTQNCMKRIDSCIASLSRNQNLKWQVFHLVTEGDFAVVVRSKFVHDAYDISTLIRSIRISSKGSIKTNAFFSYTICGILEEKALQHEHGNMISGSHVSWKNYLGSDDRIVIRMVYSPSFRIKSKLEEDIVASKNFLGDGYRLFGRYDHQESFTPEEFEKIYPYIRAFKFEKLCLSENVIEQESDSKVKRLLYMLHMGYFSYLNERLILKYNNDPVLFQKDNNIWEVETDQTEWRKIYEENEKKIEEGRRLVDTADKKLMLFFQSAHNLKEYSRLLGRFYRVLYEMNHLQELRISTARLLIQANQMLRSMLRYIENAEKENCSKKILADRIEEYLRQGIAALEISIRYARNVNLQTLQTPNYDLQTNVCIEKVLLAYSQFLQPFLEKQNAVNGGYYLSQSLFPIVVPCMSVKDLSVCVLFDDYFGNVSGENDSKVMVVFSPTFAFLCETCFMLPTSFHEIAHQFRYEGRRSRNRCLINYILKSVIIRILNEIIDPDQYYRFMDEKEMVELTDDLCKEVIKKADFVTGMDGNLQLCQVTLDDMLQCFAENVKKPVNTLESVIDYYLEHTRDDVQFYDDTICQVVAKIDACIINYNKIEIKENSNYFEEKESILQQLKVHFKNLKHLQCDQLIQLAKRLLEEQMKPGLKINQLQEDLERMEEMSPNERNLFWQETEKQILNRVLIDQLKEVMKRINNISGIYDQCKKRIDDKGMIYGEKNREFLKEISDTGYQKLLAALTEYEKRRQSELDMETSPVPGEYIQYIERKIKYGKAEGIQKEIIRFFKREQKCGLTILVRSSVELYREIASDMFMCSIMGLTVWGYLVIAAQTFVFRKESENPLYLRTSMVVQGLIRKEKGNLNGNSIYVDYLTTMLKEKVGKLMNEVEKVCIGNSLKDSLSLELETADFEQILKYLEKLLKTDGFNTTQRWILRVYYQAAHIVHNLCCATSLCSQDTVEKTIWRDLTGKHSFLAKTEKLKEILGKSVGNKLCEGIISILNAPASYFCDRGSLLEEEVKFVLLNYENGCREIMRKEY